MIELMNKRMKVGRKKEGKEEKEWEAEGRKRWKEGEKEGTVRWEQRRPRLEDRL